MKRIYITAVPLPSNFPLNASVVQCMNIQLPEDDSYTFPISRLIAATMQEGDEALVISVRQTNASGDENFNRLKKDLAERQIPYELKDITTPESQQKDFLIKLFYQLSEALEENCIIYADATFGTKTYPLVLFPALHYAVKIKNCDVANIIYQEQRRKDGKPISTSIYDITSIFLMDEVVNTLGFSGAASADKDALLKSLMQL